MDGFLNSPANLKSQNITNSTSPPDWVALGFKPIKIKYLEREKRQQDNVETIAEESSLTTLTYIDLFLQLEKSGASTKSSNCRKRMICCSAKSSAKLGILGEKLAKAFIQKIVTLLKLNNQHIQAHIKGQNGDNCAKLYLNCKIPKYNCM